LSSGRELALKGLIDFYRTTDRLDTVFTRLSVPNMAKRDWLRARVLIKECVRWRRLLDDRIDQFSNKPGSRIPLNLRALAEILAYEVLLDEGTPSYAAVNEAVNLARRHISKNASRFINAFGHTLSRKTDLPENSMSLAQRESFPDWMVDRWIKHWGETDADAVCRHLNQGTGVSIRRYPSMITESQLIDEFTSHDLKINPLSTSRRFYRLEGSTSELWTHPRFLDGSISIQGRGSGAIVELLNPRLGERILDVCAAPGTKTRYMAECMDGQGRILASDISPDRIKVAQQDDRRHPAKNIEWEVKDASKDSFPMADAILIDAPCTGTGVIGRHPDIKWRRKPEDIFKFQALQIRILSHMVQFLNPGGRLVYATCSLEPEENWDVVDAVLKLNDRIEVVPPSDQFPKHWIDDRGALHTRPVQESIDGLFGVLLRVKS